MEVLFYLLSIIAVVSTLCAVLNSYPVHALLYLIISFMSISCIFFILGAYFSGALEIIIYAGAIMVLFIFVIMMLNIDFSKVQDESLIVQLNFWKLFLLLMFLVIFLYFIWNGNNNYFTHNISYNEDIITLKSIGIKLFDSYILLVEMASMLLLVSLIISIHIGCFVRQKNLINKE